MRVLVARDLSRQRAIAGPTRCSTLWPPCVDRAGSPASSWPDSTTRGGLLHGSRRRSDARRRRGGPRPCRVPRDRRQPILRERAAAPPLGDRRASTRTPPAMGGRGPPDQIALPDSVREVIGARVGRLGPTGERCCRWRRSSAGTSISTSWRGPRDHRRRPARHPRRRGGGRPGARAANAPVATSSPTPLSNTPSTRTSAPPDGHGPPPGGGGSGGPLR